MLQITKNLSSFRGLPKEVCDIMPTYASQYFCC